MVQSEIEDYFFFQHLRFIWPVRKGTTCSFVIVICNICSVLFFFFFAIMHPQVKQSFVILSSIPLTSCPASV